MNYVLKVADRGQSPLGRVEMQPFCATAVAWTTNKSHCEQSPLGRVEMHPLCATALLLNDEANVG